MKKNKLLFITAIFLVSIAYSQSTRRVLNGIIVSDSLSVNKIHIINKTTKKGTTSNEDGTFQIPAKVLDTLIFSGVQYKVLYKVVSKEDLQKLQVTIKMQPQLNELDEVIINPISIAKRLNLPNADKKPLNKREARLEGHSKASVPIVILTTLIGGAGGIDNLYYVFSGQRKKDRKLQKLIQEERINDLNGRTLSEIKKHFKNDFFIYTLKIPAKEIDDFLEFCVEDNIIELFVNDRLLEVTEILIQKSKIYLKQEE